MQKLLHKLLDDAEAHVVDYTVTPDRFFFMRPSGFPYCGLRKLLTAPKILEDGQTSGLASAYFTSVGTAAHTAFQEYMGKSGKIVGDWYCRACKTRTQFTTFQRCKCGNDPQYDELEIRYKNTVVGHLDGLVKVDVGGKTVYIVIDYKTATASKVKAGLKNKSIFPYAYNVQQIRRYVILMEKCFGIEIAGWALIYLNRDIPLGKNNRNIVYHPMKRSEKRILDAEMDSWVKTHRMVLRARTREHFDAVKDRKLCTSDADYTKNWHNDYSPCPVRPVCFDAKRLNKKIDRVLPDDVFPLINMADAGLRDRLNMKRIKKE